ncbi:hypothetical protein [Micromonospora sp. NPDC005161]
MAETQVVDTSDERVEVRLRLRDVRGCAGIGGVVDGGLVRFPEHQVGAGDPLPDGELRVHKPEGEPGAFQG